ncbi:MAG: ribosome maturation factor RimM [Actinobacteria bacterium]|nr:ribosome maturation factor RimM [Actinomycetota bacterium]
MLLVVGRIGRAHGVRGEATIEVRTDDPDARFPIGATLQTDPASHGPLTITSGRVHNGILLLGFAGISDRTAVEKLRNTLLLSDVDIDAETSDDLYHVANIKGCKVFLADSNGESGREIGIVTDVLELPAQDTLVIETANGERLVPFVTEMVPLIDIKNKKIIIAPPEGLL